jgi:hypothetical protein
MMTRLIKYLLAGLFILSLLKVRGQQENLYSYDNTRKFAFHLFDTHQYELAAGEFERAVFLNPQDTLSEIFLARSYRLAGNFQGGTCRLDQLYNDSLVKMPAPLAYEYSLLCLANHQTSRVSAFLDRNKTLNGDTLNKFRLGALMLDSRYEQSVEFVAQHPPLGSTDYTRLAGLTIQFSQEKYKSPLAALALSAIIPGLGKGYTKNWKDGLFSFLFVTANSWQAYRGFHKDGINSPYGWIFGSLGFCFYSANLYGSWKSAKKYNVKIREKYHEDAENILFNTP